MTHKLALKIKKKYWMKFLCQNFFFAFTDDRSRDLIIKYVPHLFMSKDADFFKSGIENDAIFFNWSNELIK